jgi:hypothetical protein
VVRRDALRLRGRGEPDRPEAVEVKDDDFLYAFGRQVPRRSRRGAALANVKIGRSADPGTRIVSLASQYPGYQLWIVGEVPRMGIWEKRLHHRLAAWSTGGEWFDHVILIATMRWGLERIVAWAMDELAPGDHELATFLDVASYDIEDPSPLEQMLARQR